MRRSSELLIPITQSDNKGRFWDLIMKIEQEEYVSWWIILLTLLVATIFHIALSLLTRSPTVFVTSVYTAKQLLEGKILYKNVEKPPTTGYPAWPPVFPYSLALWFILFGSSDFAAKLFCVTSTIVAGYLCYYVGKEFLSPKHSYYAMVLFLFNPYTMLISLGGHFENYAGIFFLLAILAIKKERVSLGGVALGIAIMIKVFPGLLLIVILPFWIARREYRPILLLFIATAITISIIALPFLVLCPEGFRYYIFDFHGERTTGGVSIYYYWLPWLFKNSTLIFVLQIILLGFLAILLFIVTKKHQTINLSSILILWTPIALLLYFSSTRVLYPRYLAILIPFISWQAIFLWNRISKRGAVLEQLLSYLSMAGTVIWTFPWYLEDYHPASFTPKISLSNPLDNPVGLLYWIGAAIFDIAMFLFLAVNIWLVKRFLLGSQEKEENGQIRHDLAKS